MVMLACMGIGWPLRMSMELSSARRDGVCMSRMYAEGDREMVTLVGLGEM